VAAAVDIHPVRSPEELQAACRVVEEHLRFGARRGPAFYAARFAEQPGLLLVAEAAGELVGVLLGSLQGDAVLVGELVVVPEWRGRGVGRALVREIERAALAAGKPQLRLGSAEGAEGFYVRQGFSPTLFITLDGDGTAPALERYLAGALPERSKLVEQDAGFSKAFVPLDGLDGALLEHVERELPGAHAGYLFNKAL
jgi:GNAT superfamily N-acetyltransferase